MPVGATAKGATKPYQDCEDPLPLRRLIYLNRDDDIDVLSQSPCKIHVGITLVLFLLLHGCYEGFRL